MPAKNRGLDAERSARRSFERRIESRLADLQRDVQQLRKAIYETDRKVIALEMGGVLQPQTPAPTALPLDRMLNPQLGKTERWFFDQIDTPKRCPGCGRPEDECDTAPLCRPEGHSTV